MEYSNWRLTYYAKWSYEKRGKQRTHILRARSAQEAKEYLRKRIDERVRITHVKAEKIGD